jgi:site-specific recombinase XerD
MDASQLRVVGPLEPFAAGFREELRRLGYTELSVRAQLWLAAHLSRWMDEHGVAARGLNPETVAAFVAARRALGRTAFRSVKALEPLVGYLQRLGVVPAPPAGQAPTDPIEVVLERYRRYLLSERGVSAKTAADYLAAVRPLLAAVRPLLAANAGEVRGADGRAGSMTGAVVAAFVVAECRRRRVRSAQLVATATRSLLRFLHVEGMVDGSLAAAVPKLADRRQALPRALAPEQVQALLASCDDRPAGRRDRAILVLLARLGLRAGEVAALRLDDVDWRRGEIVVRGKPNRCDRLPLPVDVGETLAAYLQQGRPATAGDRQVFVRVLAPHRGLSPTGVTQVVVAAAQRAGLGWVTAHRLRHSAATAMLRAGAPLVEIGQVLRHRRPATTAVYAKADSAALVALARPWPGGAA